MLFIKTRCTIIRSWTCAGLTVRGTISTFPVGYVEVSSIVGTDTFVILEDEGVNAGRACTEARADFTEVDDATFALLGHGIEVLLN